jgi:M6 family metalloprotease-like protein
MNGQMKKKNWVLVPLALVFGLALGGCNLNSETTSTHWVDDDGKVASGAASSLTYHDLTKQLYPSLRGHKTALPSQGDVNVLVIPVEFSGYPFSESRLTDLNHVFSGTNEDTSYWQSLSGFYQQSSYGALNLQCTLSETYALGVSPYDFVALNASEETATSKTRDVLRSAVSAYKTAHGADSTKKFDNDGDGYIDGVYLIYSYYDYDTAKNQYSHEVNSNTYWAFTYWDTSSAANVDSPTGNAYFWASYDFMYEGVKEGSGVDAHTFIHETGHLLGLDDYYNYDDNDQESNLVPLKYRHYAPMGGLAMMDYNILDHDAWSKWALGWTKPKILMNTITMPTTVTLSESESTGDMLVIPDASSSFNGSAFGEYLVVELYTPDGLNQLDSSKQYRDSYPRGFKMPGVKIYHVDSRLALIKDQKFANYLDSSDALTPTLLASSTSTNYYAVAASNTPSYSLVNQGYRLIHLMESGAVNTLQNYPDTSSVATDGSLFVGSEGHNLFSMNRFASFFENGEHFNNGHGFGYSLEVNAIVGNAQADGSTRYSVSLTVRKA